MGFQDCDLILTFGDNELHSLSAILSFLNEVDGTSLLITNIHWSRRVLPVFRIPHHILKTLEPTKERANNERKLLKTRHRFQILPVQDSFVLLQRLNTTRLAARLRQKRRNGEEAEARASLKESQIYPYNMSTDEMAWYEWTKDRSSFIMNNQIESEIQPNNRDAGPKFDLLRYRNPPSNSNFDFRPKMKNTNTSIPQHLEFLPPKILPGATVLSSYPRSGNTLLRSLLERITNIVTGSDTRPDRTLSKALAVKHDLVGEGITNYKRAPIIKTHFPERRGYMMYNATRIILLVRNPYDAIDSYWNMCCTNTHTDSVTEEIYDMYEEMFRSLACAEMSTWLRFHKYWLQECNTTFKSSDGSGGGPPILLIRFEDLIRQTESVMEQVMTFITLDDQNTGGELHPFWKWRIRRALGLTESQPSTSVITSNLGSYKPRSHDDGTSHNGGQRSKSSSIGKSLGKNRYTRTDVEKMHQLAEEESINHPSNGNVNILQLFGYDITTQNFPSNFERDETTSSHWDYIYPQEYRQKSTVRINKGKELRPTDSPFGRAMTRWRRSQTDDDAKPFPIKNK